MGVFDRKDDPNKASDKGKAGAPDFSNVRSGGSSTAPSPPGQAPATRTYVVEKGDSLSKIAKREYGDANKWRQIYETTGLTWAQVAAICPRDGETPCEGAIGSKVLTGWVWGTADQVVLLMGNYAPEILTAEPPSVGGPEYFGIAANFLAELRWTFYVSGYGFYHEVGAIAGFTPTRPAARPAAAPASAAARTRARSRTGCCARPAGSRRPR